eukprot:3166246-Alexandrium_andersonii.AAC.1
MATIKSIVSAYALAICQLTRGCRAHSASACSKCFRENSHLCTRSRALAPILPKPAGHGQQATRTHSCTRTRARA